jgi:3'-phosphoadenosine 5'-phosphosulfate sulfotransferase (PAPS reductase)/FAD synthetase
MTEKKQDYYIVSFSGGKDSTAMLLRLLELEEPINEVVCCDTYKEFPQMYEHIEKIRKIVEDKGITFTLLRHERTFDEWMFEYEPKRRDPEAFRKKYGDVKGKSWATSRARWCSGELKIKLMDRYFRDKEKIYNVKRYIGLAADETNRLERDNNKNPNYIFPLVQWNWTEAYCLEYCYALGYDWGGLYKLFKRVSCWCCPLQPLEALRTLYTNFPDLWAELKDMDNRTWQEFKPGYSVEDLEKRFNFETEQLSFG